METEINQQTALEMLRALENALVDPSKPLRDWQIRLIVDAIAKAKGNSPQKAAA